MTESSSLTDALAAGRDLRRTLSRRDQAEFVPVDRDPVAILEEQHTSRLQGLVPVRVGRMLQSPFAYYRGTAAVMAFDLAGAPVTGHDVVICGDAHVSNFGMFASPERRVLFDLNDFDEAGFGPWEWDVKRLAASAYIGARDNGFDEGRARDASVAASRGYRRTIRKLCELPALERYYFHVETDLIERNAARGDRDVLRRSVRKATRRTSDQLVERITTAGDSGAKQIVDQPPVMMHVAHATEEEMRLVVERYVATLRADTALLFSQYALRDWVLRIVGVGSVGTRCYVLYFEGPAGEPLFLQAKEAPLSVLETYGGRSGRLPVPTPDMSSGHQGFRVVSAQRILQAQSDPFLGWIAGFRGESEVRTGADYYWRQFRDMKGAIELGELSPSQFEDYASLCGALLARAHSQSPGAALVAGYVGASDRFDEAIADWSRAYTEQVDRDFAALERAVREGRLPAEVGV